MSFSLHRLEAGFLSLALCLCSSAASGADHPSRGLWAGEAVVSNVTEVVVGINSANQVVAPDPNVPTPTADRASVRLLLHVDGNGQTRLLKSVAVFDKSTNATPDIALVTDEMLFPNFPTRGKRFSSATFDFGEGRAVEALNYLVHAAATVAGSNAFRSASPSVISSGAVAAASRALTEVDLDAGYQAFATGVHLRNGALGAAAGAAQGAIAARGGTATPAQVQSAALAAATNAFLFVRARTNALALQMTVAFADPRYLQSLQEIAQTVATAAATNASAGANVASTGTAATNGANFGLTAAANAPTAISAGYNAFIASPAFRTNSAVAAGAASAAGIAAVPPAADVTEADLIRRVEAEALKAVIRSGALAAAERVQLNEVKLAGNFFPGGTVAGQIFLGADHPTNPFKHRRHPDHTSGITITREVTLEVSAAAAPQTGFNVERLTGIYREEIFGLHKPLGPQQNIGLRAQGSFVLHRISEVDTLNQ